MLRCVGRVSSPLAVWLPLALVWILVACGKSRRDGSPPRASVGGSSLGGASGASAGTAGLAAGNAGATDDGQGGAGHAAGVGGRTTAGAAGRTSAGHSGTGGIAGRPAGGEGGATGGEGGTAQADAGEGGAGAPDECGLDVPAVSCNAAPAGNVATIVDFANYSSSGEWSSSTAAGITGRTSLYHSSSAKDVALAVDAGVLHVTATLEPTSFAGWLFAFDACSNGSANAGLLLPLQGDFGGATLTLRVQTNADYPVGFTPGRGACAFTSCATMESECKAPSIDLPAEKLSQSVQYVFWNQFMGGMPEHDVTPDAIWGLQFELACSASTECVVDFTLGTVTYDQL